MTQLTLLITKPPNSNEDAQRMCGISEVARNRGFDVTVYLIGDGVLCAKRGQKGVIGKHMKSALQNGVRIKANASDLLARAILPEQSEPGVEIIDDLEGEFVEEIMEKSDRVISW